MDRTLLNTLLAFALIIAGAWLLGKILLPFLSPIAWALVVGIITFPGYRYLLRLLKGREVQAAGLMTLAVILLLVVPVISLISVLAQEVSALYTPVSARVNSGGADQLFQRWLTDPRLAPYVEQLKSLLGETSFNLSESLVANSKEALSRLLSFLTTLLANSFGFLVNLLFMLFVLFFVYHDGQRALNWLRCMLPFESDLQARLFRVVQNVLSGFIFGTLLTSLVQGVLAGAAYLVFGVPSPLLLAVLTGIGGLIPVVGTAIIWLPAAIYLYLQGAAIKALILVAWGFLAVGMSDKFVKPIFMSSRVTLPLLPIMIGAFGGLAAFGVLGAIFGPLLLAILYELYVVEPESLPDEAAQCARQETDEPC
jgi:predicted PurR-regulated permease PerM